MTTRAITILIAMLVVVSLIGAWVWDRERDAEERGRLSERIKSDSILIVKLGERTADLDTVLRQVSDTVLRVVRRADTVVRQIPPVTRRETILVAQVETLQAACLACVRAAAAYRDTASQQIEALTRLNASLRAAARTTPRKLFSLGGAVGVGCVYAGSEAIRCGPGATVGVTITP